MIQEFSVRNFLSFRDKETISFLATSDKKLIDELTYEPKKGVKLLRMAMIYGANASGKSNLLQAIQALWQLLFSPLDKEHKKIEFYNPFELSKNEATFFEIIFWIKDRKFKYEIEYNNTSILYEKMMYTTDSGILSDLFERTINQEIKFGSTLNIKAQQKNDLNKETLSNHTVLSTLNKKNINVPSVMKELYEWIKSNVHELGVHNNAIEIAEQAEKDVKLKNILLELLSRADFNISNFKLIDSKLSKELIEEIKNDDDIDDKMKEKLVKPRKDLVFSHFTEKDEFQISFHLESTGTRVFFRLARLLYDLGNGGCLLMEDELEDSLHYDLLIHFLQTYLQINIDSQLIFTTHNQLLLDEDWMIRRDMVWFIEKDRNTSGSTMYRASELGIHKNLSLLNAYKVGKLGAKPNLGSTIFNVS
nr:ATP-binding protein [Flavobacterium sp.]